VAHQLRDDFARDTFLVRPRGISAS
jgi:hypothetical protein